MAFTSLDILHKHLVYSQHSNLDVYDLPVALSGLDDYYLPDQNIEPYSETVKWLTANSPSQNSITLKNYDASDIGSMHLVRNSVVVALAEDLQTVYVEERDYHVDYANGRITRVDGTTIPNYQTVLVFFMAYDAFDSANDYTIEYDKGLLHRVSGTTIPDNITVLIDYKLTDGSLQEGMLEQAITEANDIVLRALSSDYTESSTDQGLETGTTYLALSIFARARSAQNLLESRATDSANRSREWLNLSAAWEKKAWEVLSPFLDPNMLRSPIIRSGVLCPFKPQPPPHWIRLRPIKNVAANCSTCCLNWG